MSKLRRPMAILASALAVASGAVVLSTTRAADQVVAPAARAKPAATKSAATNTSGANTAAAKPPAANTKPTAAGTPQVPEESATIRDDPTIVPDPKQSADNHVSFPNDI